MNRTEMMGAPRRKTVKYGSETHTTLNNSLPDEIVLIILHYCNEEDIKNTRQLQSKWVKQCTMDVDMKTAVRKQNMDNMQWLQGRCNGELYIRKTEYTLIDMGTCAKSLCYNHELINLGTSFFFNIYCDVVFFLPTSFIII